LTWSEEDSLALRGFIHLRRHNLVKRSHGVVGELVAMRPRGLTQKRVSIVEGGAALWRLHRHVHPVRSEWAGCRSELRVGRPILAVGADLRQHA